MGVAMPRDTQYVGMESPLNRRQRLMTPTRFWPNQVGVARSSSLGDIPQGTDLAGFFCAPNLGVN